MTITQCLRPIRVIAASAVFLSVPAYAVSSLVAGTAAPDSTVALARVDDPIRSGFRVVEPPIRAAQTPVLSDRTPSTETVDLSEWTFTNKGKPSPYQ
jgi:hypothetical protein